MQLFFLKRSICYCLAVRWTPFTETFLKPGLFSYRWRYRFNINYHFLFLVSRWSRGNGKMDQTTESNLAKIISRHWYVDVLLFIKHMPFTAIQARRGSLFDKCSWIVPFYFESIFSVKNYSQQTKRSESFHWNQKHYGIIFPIFFIYCAAKQQRSLT